MRRSDINQRIRESQAFFAAHGVHLPPWATWSPDRWRAHPDTAVWCGQHQMGWDITDFGSGDFHRRGLVLFCLRNGIQRRAGEVPYAEKVMVVQEGQETPMHQHAIKMEDIIVRAGGELVVELFNSDVAGGPLDTPVTVRTDGLLRTLQAGEPLILGPGESITIHRHLYHRFYGRTGSGPVLVGEVSQVNDDLADNRFLEAPARFVPIEEDAPAEFLLWNELSA